MKYITVQDAVGNRHPVIFQDSESHAQMLQFLKNFIGHGIRVYSAGYVRYNTLSYVTHNKSFSLGVESCESDGALITELFERDAYSYIMFYGDHVVALVPTDLLMIATSEELPHLAYGSVHVTSRDRSDETGILQIMVEPTHKPRPDWVMQRNKQRHIKNIVNCHDY